MKILMLEDNKLDAELIQKELAAHKFDFTFELVETEKNFITAIHNFKPDIILSDYSLPQFTGFEALEIAKKLIPDIPFIIVTGSLSEEMAVDSMKKGAWNYVIKENLSRLTPAIKNVLKLKEERDKNRLAEEALIKSNENFKQVVSNIAIVIWKADIANDGTFENTYTSPFLDEILALPAGTMKNDWDKYFGYIKPDYLEQVNNAFREAIMSPGKPIDCEYELVKDNGQTIWVNSKGRCFEKNGKLHVFGSTTDITERKQAEEALRKSEEKHRLLAENTIDCIWQMNLDLEFTYINQAVFPLFGYTTKEWTGSKLSEHCSSKEMKKTLAIISDALANLPEKTTEVFEMSIYHKNGEEISCEITGKIILGDAGNPVYIQGSTRDITERKSAEKELQDSERRLKTILDSMQTGIVVINAETHTIVDANPAAIKMIGAPKEKIIGHVCHNYICPAEKGKCPITDLGQKIDNSERILLKANGEEISIIKTVTTVLLGGKECLLDSFIDITEKKKLESQLQQAQKMETIGTLAGGIAHDFNNILFPILGYSDMLLADIPEDSPIRDSLNGIHTSALRATDLVKQILSFARQDTTEAILMKMQPVVKEALRLIRSTIPTTIDITLDINADCSAIKADPTQIHQIVMNLATNAYHAMEETGGELKVSLKEVELGEQDVIIPDMTPGDYACLTVSDTGTGMDKNVTEKIFDPFFTTKAIGKGTGMGLSVVHGIVKSMDGSIHVYSEPGKGTEFKAYFPIEKSSFKKQNIQTKEPVQGGTEQILLVDDEEVIIAMEKQVLERLGYQVTSRTSSLEALEAFRANPDTFDLVITDMAMPNMPGDKLSTELIKIRSDIPILICTGFSEIMSEEKATSLGIKRFILKPIVMKDLARKIREVLD
ncbi:PAS domain S-box protein [Desulfobacula sp.]|uniref:hybrid sensor histidine kinase/response regulator n=1 Tax=Desulfobacula sp. TaxID=2593537 RepID=UPI0025BF3441|nr:PAS domain S-box protein [Desulfobacula sp.]MBC2704617.1 PAS domain S-box protein [Desulfobacula sp.]